MIALVGFSLLASERAAAAPALHGPAGVSRDKVLVIGTDGTRWDKLQEVIAAGRAPNFAKLIERGFGVPSTLAYAPPEAATISEVGWCTIASGVWPNKHGVYGLHLNTDPGQATKNGYDDFLTRVESERPRLSTFLASDWENIGLPESGGPIFSDAIDARSATATENTLEAWDAADREVTRVTERYLRRGDPDVGFVYLGVVDESAHLVGSATPAYTDSIARTDKRIGRLMHAISRRPDRRREHWTIIVTTDHGQQNFSFPSFLSHGLGSGLETTSFVIASGPGMRDVPSPESVQVVDIAATVFDRLGITIDPTWRLDGRSFFAPSEPPG